MCRGYVCRGYVCRGGGVQQVVCCPVGPVADIIALCHLVAIAYTLSVAIII